MNFNTYLEAIDFLNERIEWYAERNIVSKYVKTLKILRNHAMIKAAKELGDGASMEVKNEIEEVKNEG